MGQDQKEGASRTLNPQCPWRNVGGEVACMRGGTNRTDPNLRATLDLLLSTTGPRAGALPPNIHEPLYFSFLLPPPLSKPWSALSCLLSLLVWSNTSPANSQSDLSKYKQVLFLISCVLHWLSKLFSPTKNAIGSVFCFPGSPKPRHPDLILGLQKGPALYLLLPLPGQFSPQAFTAQHLSLGPYLQVLPRGQEPISEYTCPITLCFFTVLFPS